MTFLFFFSSFSNLYLQLYIPFLFRLFNPFIIPFSFLLTLYGLFYPFSTWTFLSLCALDFSILFLYGLFYHFHFFPLNHFSIYSLATLVWIDIYHFLPCFSYSFSLNCGLILNLFRLVVIILPIT